MQNILKEGDNNFLIIAKNNNSQRLELVELTNDGFYLVRYTNNTSVFEKYNPKTFLKYMPEKAKTKYNLIYTLDEPSIKADENYLLIIFSSFQINPYLPDDPYKRYFLQDYEKASHYIPQNTYILRIADIGGVAGGFYLNTNFDSTMEDNMTKLIEYIRKKHQIKKHATLLLGYSKGATAAFFYGVKDRYRCICVDPILSDEYHAKTYNDSHFTQGVFPVTKQEKFLHLLQKKELHSNIYIITSERSQQYSYITSTLKHSKTKNRVNIINSLHTKIKEHIDVGPNTKHIVYMLLNAIFYNVIKKRSFTILA